MHCSSAVALIAAIGLSCSARGDPHLPRAGARAPSTRTPAVDVAATTRALVPLALALSITPAGLQAQRFTATGDGECHHYVRPADHGGAEWEVRYRGESGPGIRMLVLRTTDVAGDLEDDVDMQLDAGDTMRLIHRAADSRSRADTTRDPGRAHVSIARLGSGARLTIDGVFSDGARIGGSIRCMRLSSEP
ncbi:MAG TPA: hypothetical protein VFJ96_14030 [Gemmatimonadaceae bacterium]|nr:hypothetical protein [Gemmatimonadaceae bacterium]